MPPRELVFTTGGSTQWAGMGDYVLVSPDHSHHIVLKYEGEPPHGDSYHSGLIDGRAFRGHIWGCMFAFSPCSRYFVCSWMQKFYERLTVTVDLENKVYFVLPEYIYDFDVRWPTIIGKGERYKDIQYSFQGNEQWVPY